MADALTDEELVAKLREYGESEKYPLKAGRRPLLIKKLNHLQARHKEPVKTPRRPARRAIDALSSDDSDADTPFVAEDRRTRVSEAVNRSLKKRSPSSSIAYSQDRSGANDRSDLNRPSLRTRRSVTNRTESPSTSTRSTRNSSRLYPDLNQSDAGANAGLYADSTIDSDPDLDISTYSVQNRSVNTSFNLEPEPDTATNYSLNHVRKRERLANASGGGVYTNNHVAARSKNKGSASKHTSRNTYPDCLSRGLIVGVVLFFVVLLCGYVFTRENGIKSLLPFSSTPALGDMSDGHVDKFLLCGENTEEPCFTNDLAQRSLLLASELFDHLSKMAGDVVCGYDKLGVKTMTANKLKKYLSERSPQHEELYRALLEHIIANPHWQIKAMTRHGEAAEKSLEVVELEASEPYLDFWCRLRRAVWRVCEGFLVLLAVCVGLFILYLALQWRMKQKERAEKRVYQMVDQIIEILKQHSEEGAGEDVDHGVAVQHIRDQLLPPSQRRELQPIWDAAVDFIEANESRVRMETRTIQGEEFMVWRWINSMKNGGKVWQGQAFGELNDNSGSSNVYSPTPCLKIRNMFDADIENAEDWHVAIEDALLEKCRNISSVMHIHVDQDSKEGCVYMRCSSCEAAGKARQALHGWWFDGRLVTVKYLRLETYLSRFPEARNLWRSLRPSTDSNRSLSQPYHRSTLEMT